MTTQCPYCAVDTAGNHAWNCPLSNPNQIDFHSWDKGEGRHYYDRRIKELEQQLKEANEAISSADNRAERELREVERLRSALQKIRDEEGKVCEEYEICDHAACRSSYRSWAYAEQALKGGE